MKRLPGHPGRLVSWFRNLLAGVSFSGRQRPTSLACGSLLGPGKQSLVPFLSSFLSQFPLISLTHTHTHMFSVNWMQHHGCGPPRWFPQGRPTHPTCLQAPPTGWQTTITAAGICVVEYSHQQWSVPKSSWLMPLKQLQGKNQFLTVLNSREILILDN